VVAIAETERILGLNYNLKHGKLN